MKNISTGGSFDWQIPKAKFRKSFWRTGYSKWLLALIFFLLVVIICGNAKAGDWSYSGSVQYAYGNYIYTTKTQSYYVLSHLRYRTNRYRLILGLPVIAQNSSLIAFGGGGMMPRRGVVADDDIARNHEGGMGFISESNASQFNLGFGDLFLNGDYTMLNEVGLMPAITLTGQLKMSTGNTSMGISTGAWDYGAGLSFRKSESHRYAVVDVGYYWLGDTLVTDYQNTQSFGAGYGHRFENGKYGFLLYLSGYSKILHDYQAPSQFSFIANYQVNSGVALNGGFNYGLSNTVPDFAIFAGVTSTL
jgi:hypothetical protein